MIKLTVAKASFFENDREIVTIHPDFERDDENKCYRKSGCVTVGDRSVTTDDLGFVFQDDQSLWDKKMKMSLAPSVPEA